MPDTPRLPLFPSPSPSSPALRILLVDDHSLFLEGLRNLMTSEGFQVIGLAHDGLDALAQARHHHPDVILMDIHMPRCDGVTATRLIKAELPECKIVILSISEEDQDLFDAVKSGASGYLLKRLDAAEFFTCLAELQAGHLPFSSGLAEKILTEFSQQAQRSAASPAPTNADVDKVQADSSTAAELSLRQKQILTLIAQGQTYCQVAEILGLAERTVKYHMAEILKRLHLKNRAQVIAYATQMGLTRDV